MFPLIETISVRDEVKLLTLYVIEGQTVICAFLNKKNIFWTLYQWCLGIARLFEDRSHGLGWYNRSYIVTKDVSLLTIFLQLLVSPHLKLYQLSYHNCSAQLWVQNCSNKWAGSKKVQHRGRFKNCSAMGLSLWQFNLAVGQNYIAMLRVQICSEEQMGSKQLR